jgi:PAS domain S-box-containing protein
MSIRNDAAALLAAIVSSADDAIISKDLDGYVTSWNPGAERLFGYTAGEMIGEHITRIIPAERRAEEDFVLSRIRAGTGVDHFETVRQRKDGSLVDISLTVSPVRDADGEVIGASKIARDITEQKQLRLSVEEASRAKDEFLATLSHELRTPLNTVLGYTAMLQSGAVPLRDLVKVLDAIGRNADALTRLVNDVLDTSRIATGKIRLTVQECDISTIVEDAITTITPAAQAKSIRVASTIEPGLLLQADPDRLRQVFWNLLSNAVKFTPEGGSVAISGVRDSRAVRISVEDSGIGIAPESLPYVFRRFWQEETPNSRAHGGLGLGLALARDFVELHGGRVDVHSEGLGRGARFDVTLPALVSVGANAKRRSSPLDADSRADA